MNHHYAHSASNSLGHEASGAGSAGINLALSMGVNIGSYGYQNGRGNLLQQLNYSNVHGPNNNPNGPRVNAELRGRPNGERGPDEEAQEDEENDEVNELL